MPTSLKFWGMLAILERSRCQTCVWNIGICPAMMLCGSWLIATDSAKTSSKWMAYKCCANGGAKYENNSCCCVVTMQQASGSRGRKVFRSFPPQSSCCNNLTSTLTLTNNQQCEGRSLIFPGLNSESEGNSKNCGGTWLSCPMWRKVRTGFFEFVSMTSILRSLDMHAQYAFYDLPNICDEE